MGMPALLLQNMELFPIDDSTGIQPAADSTGQPGSQPGSDQAIKLKFHHKRAKEGRFHRLNRLFRNQNSYAPSPSGGGLGWRFKSADYDHRQYIYEGGSMIGLM